MYIFFTSKYHTYNKQFHKQVSKDTFGEKNFVIYVPKIFTFQSSFFYSRKIEKKRCNKQHIYMNVSCTVMNDESRWFYNSVFNTTIHVFVSITLVDIE